MSAVHLPQRPTPAPIIIAAWLGASAMVTKINTASACFMRAAYPHGRCDARPVFDGQKKSATCGCPQHATALPPFRAGDTSPQPRRRHSVSNGRRQRNAICRPLAQRLSTSRRSQNATMAENAHFVGGPYNPLIECAVKSLCSGYPQAYPQQCGTTLFRIGSKIKTVTVPEAGAEMWR